MQHANVQRRDLLSLRISGRVSTEELGESRAQHVVVIDRVADDRRPILTQFLSSERAESSSALAEAFTVMEKSDGKVQSLPWCASSRRHYWLVAIATGRERNDMPSLCVEGRGKVRI